MNISKQKALIIIPYNYDIAETEQILKSQVTSLVSYGISKIQRYLSNDNYSIYIANEHTFIYEGWRGYRFDNVLIHCNCRISKNTYSEIIPMLFQPTTDYGEVYKFSDENVCDIMKYLPEHYTVWGY